MTAAERFDPTVARAATVLAGTAATLVKTHDVLGTVTQLLISATRATGAAAGGLILRRLGQDHLELLAATSHRAEELELYQIQIEQGPCFEAVQTGAAAAATGIAAIEQRWPEVAGYFARAGFQSAQATPLIWHGDTIGALNLFWTHEEMPSDEVRLLIQAFTDMSTLAIVHSTDIPIGIVLQRIRGALGERTIVEQAKGVVAQDRGLSMADAFLVLLDMATAADEPLTGMAATVVERAAVART